MIDIGRRMESLLPKIQKGPQKGYGATDAKPECKDEWSPKYAIICDVLCEAEALESRYFDVTRWRGDIVQMAMKAFSKKGHTDPVFAYDLDEILVVPELPPRQKRRRLGRRHVLPGTVIIRWHRVPCELEVYVAALPKNTKKARV